MKRAVALLPLLLGFRLLGQTQVTVPAKMLDCEGNYCLHGEAGGGHLDHGGEARYRTLANRRLRRAHRGTLRCRRGDHSPR